MTQRSHQTAPTQFVEADGIGFAYRRFGSAAGVPLVFNMHFTGTMDHWDPMVTDGLSRTCLTPSSSSIRISITGRSTSIPRYSSLA
jgi:hypothetical protein